MTSRKSHLWNHLLSEMTSEKPVINPRQFAVDYMKVEHRDSYISHLEENDITENQFGRTLHWWTSTCEDAYSVYEWRPVIALTKYTEMLSDWTTRWWSRPCWNYWKNRKITQYEPNYSALRDKWIRKNQSTSCLLGNRRKHNQHIRSKGFWRELLIGQKNLIRFSKKYSQSYDDPFQSDDWFAVWELRSIFKHLMKWKRL